jgi:hypothetical protein
LAQPPREITEVKNEDDYFEVSNFEKAKMFLEGKTSACEGKSDLGAK